jgi:hypothetical protein
LYIGKCAACHSLYPVNHLTAERWPATIADMANRAHLQPDERERIVRYVLSAEHGQMDTARR